MKRLNWILAVVIFSVLAVFFKTHHIQKNKIYIAPSGVDNLSRGLSVDNPILTLKFSQILVDSILKKFPNRNLAIEILIASGTYSNVSLTWTVLPVNLKTLHILGMNPTNKPIFDGSELKETGFLSFRATAGKPTNISISNLHVQNYFKGISFLGDPNKPIQGWNGSNSISNCIFEKIGSRYTNPVNPTSPRRSDAVITLTNSRNNIIEFNVFKEIHNLESAPEDATLHSLYLAHFSNNNIIRNNIFMNQHSGAPVNIRNYSNDNVVKNNLFKDIKPWAIAHWHCEKSDKTLNPLCPTFKYDECPSFGTLTEGNIFEETPLIDYLRPYKSFSCLFKAESKFFIKKTNNIKTELSEFSLIVTATPNGRHNFGLCKYPTDCVTSGGYCFQDGSILPPPSNLKCQSTAPGESVWLK
ncbi:MAG: hypothetical protein IPK04_14735 [Bdellovibrionales bacterium]|nr:hypothetical protein [Bdellovibrionales bacterium]